MGNHGKQCYGVMMIKILNEKHDKTVIDRQSYIYCEL